MTTDGEAPNTNGSGEATVTEEKRRFITKEKIIFLAIAAVLIGAMLYITYDFNGKSLDLSHSEPRYVLTQSMEGVDQPFDIVTIPQYSEVMIRKDVAFEDIKLGDVLAFRGSNGMITVHRVIKIDTENQAFTTRGDYYVKLSNGGINTTEANGTIASDPQVTYSRVVGVVVGDSVLIGSVVGFTHSDNMFFILALVLIAIMAISIVDIIRIYHQGSKEEKENK